MLRYALRRILWAIPTLIGISLVVFFLTTLLPDPAGITWNGTGETDADLTAHFNADEAKRARFLDLPRFFNERPSDVRTRASSYVAHLAADDDQRAYSGFLLARLGGAGLPYVLSALEQLAPEARGRVALALTPVAERMGLATAAELEKAEQAVLFWTRFWEDRALEFTDPSVNRAVDRLVTHGTDAREHDLREVDTYALPEIIAAMVARQPPPDRATLERLTRIASHVSQRGIRVMPADDDGIARRAIADWSEWWYVHENDYTALADGTKISATVGETRYGKWVLRAVSGQLGIAVDGESIASKMKQRAPVTLLITSIAMFASYALAVPIGVVVAWRRGRPVDTVTAAGLFALYSLPTFWTAQLLRLAFSSSLATEGATGAARLVLPIVALTLASLATLTRYQRTAMLDVLGQDYVRTARAKGVSTFRVLTVHALRNALLPTVTLAGLQLPALLGGAFIVEETFAVPGLGYETVRAVQLHDAGWLLSVIVLMALVTTAGLIASDVAYGLLDPRVREGMLTRRGAP